MNILVTVGTTPFHSLIKELSENLDADIFNIIFQVAEKLDEYNEDNYFTYLDGIEEYYNDADIVITHAGAGSIYTLLDLKCKIIVVPNLERMDKHQTEMADFVGDNGYGAVAYEASNIDAEFLYQVNKCQFKRFLKESFFLRDHVFEGL